MSISHDANSKSQRTVFHQWRAQQIAAAQAEYDELNANSAGIAAAQAAINEASRAVKDNYAAISSKLNENSETLSQLTIAAATQATKTTKTLENQEIQSEFYEKSTLEAKGYLEENASRTQKISDGVQVLLAEVKDNQNKTMDGINFSTEKINISIKNLIDKLSDTAQQAVSFHKELEFELTGITNRLQHIENSMQHLGKVMDENKAEVKNSRAGVEKCAFALYEVKNTTDIIRENTNLMLIRKYEYAQMHVDSVSAYALQYLKLICQITAAISAYDHIKTHVFKKLILSIREQLPAHIEKLINDLQENKIAKEHIELMIEDLTRAVEDFDEELHGIELEPAIIARLALCYSLSGRIFEYFIRRPALTSPHKGELP